MGLCVFESKFFDRGDPLIIQTSNLLGIRRNLPGNVLNKAIIAILFFGFTSVAMADKEVELTHKFTGQIADVDLAAASPESGIVRDVASWKKLWLAWRPNEPIHQIDFENQIVFVETAPGPNAVIANELKLNDHGDLRYETGSSRTGGPGFGYLIMVVPRAGIKTVNGMTMDGKPVQPKAMETGTDDGTPPTQPANRPRTDETVRDAKPPRVIPSSPGQEFVKVEIVGRIRTQFRSVGAATTGTLVAANGIVWELDLQQDARMTEVARRLGNSLARIKGTLKMQRQRGGIEARVRWIVGVESLEPLGVHPEIPPATLPAERPMTGPENTPPIAGDPRPNPISPDPTETGRETIPQQDDPTVTDEQDPDRTNFKRLTLVTSDGQTQVVNSDGSVHYKSKPRNISNDWTIDASTLAKLHRFVAETEWSRVPKITRSNANDPNELNYTISIETTRGVTRFFVDRTAVPSQPIMKSLFDIISEMAKNR